VPWSVFAPLELSTNGETKEGEDFYFSSCWWAFSEAGMVRREISLLTLSWKCTRAMHTHCMRELNKRCVRCSLQTLLKWRASFYSAESSTGATYSRIKGLFQSFQRIKQCYRWLCVTNGKVVDRKDGKSPEVNDGHLTAKFPVFFKTGRDWPTLTRNICGCFHFFQEHENARRCKMILKNQYLFTYKKINNKWRLHKEQYDP